MGGRWLVRGVSVRLPLTGGCRGLARVCGHSRPMSVPAPCLCFFSTLTGRCLGLHGRCVSSRQDDAYRHEISAGGVVVGDEVVFVQPLPGDQFRLHAVGARPCGGQACLFRLAGVAVSVHIERQPPAHDIRLVALYALQEALQFAPVSLPWHIEHVLLRHEAEGVGRVCSPVREGRASSRRLP